MNNGEPWAVHAITWFIGAGAAGIAALLNRAIKRLDSDMEKHARKLEDHDKLHAHCTLELSAFKTEVAKDYAKEVTMQQSLARIHERIDSVGDQMEAGFKEIRSDIKVLIGRVK